MNSVLETIVRTGQVSDGTTVLPLRHPDHPNLAVAVDRGEGEYLQRVIADIRPHTSVEVGCAYGVSSLYICEALARLPHPVRHVVIDPFQSTQWRGIGLKHLCDAGFGGLVDFRENYSELVLPELLRAGTEIQLAFIDGWHTFDQVLVEFFYVNRMLLPGGVIIFDDADRRSVNRVIRHALTYPAYHVYGTSESHSPATSLRGRVRRLVASLPGVRDALRPDLIRRDWDLGILGSCVAIRKVADDRRSSGWDHTF